MAIASLIMGIIGCVSFWIPFVDVATLLISIGGFVISCLNKNPKNETLAAIAKTVCIIALILSVVGVFACTTCYSCALCDAAAKVV